MKFKVGDCIVWKKYSGIREIITYINWRTCKYTYKFINHTSHNEIGSIMSFNAESLECDVILDEQSINNKLIKSYLGVDDV